MKKAQPSVVHFEFLRFLRFLKAASDDLDLVDHEEGGV